MNMLEHMIFEPRNGMFREFQGLTTHFEPDDRALYHSLLPEPFSVPSRSVVTLFVADYIRVAPWPMSRYQEWSVLLKAEWNGMEGWHSITMPVTKRVPMFGGRYLGFPKYVVDDITLAKSETTWLGAARHRGVEQLQLEFSSGVQRPLQPWENELAENESLFKGDAFQLVPPGRGPRVRIVTLHHAAPPKWSPEQGMVRVSADPNEAWSALVPTEGEFPGTYNHFIGGINLVPKV